MSEIMNMGSHTVYVWSAYGIVILGMAVLLVRSFYNVKKRQVMLDRLREAKKQART